MDESLDDLLFYLSELPEARRADVRAALAADPALKAAWGRWLAVRSELAGRLVAGLHGRDVLVLYALEAEGLPGLLEADEQARLSAARADIEEALRQHPALNDVVARIQADRRAFEEAWTTEFDPAGGGRDRAPTRRRRTGNRWAWRVAASLAVAAFVVLSVLLLQRDRGLLIAETAPGEVRVVTLADGSAIRLVGEARLAYPDPGREGLLSRRTRLTGRAFFDIVPGSETFIVETPTAVATVLGTQFALVAGAEATEVVLATGRLAVAGRAAPEQIVVLEPGQASRVASNALPSTPVAVDLAEVLAWTDQFIFRATPFSQIAARLSEHYRIPITYAPALAEEPVTGTFSEDEPLDEILEVLAATLGAAVRLVPDGGYAVVLLSG